MATGVAAAPVTVAHAAPVAVAHHAGYGKREAEPEAAAEAEADAGHYGYAAAPLVAAAAPVCESVPVKTCNKVQQLAEYLTVVKYFCNCTNIFYHEIFYQYFISPAAMQVPVSTPRKVARTVCKTVVDITTIEDCQVDIRLDIYISKYLLT